MELSQDNNTVANEWCSVATSLPFMDQLPVAAHDGKLALKEGLLVWGLTYIQPKENVLR